MNDEKAKPSITFNWDQIDGSWPDTKTLECDPFQMMLVAHDMISKPMRFVNQDGGDALPQLTIIFRDNDKCAYTIISRNVNAEQVIAQGYFYKIMAESYMIDALMKIKEGQDRIEQVQQRKLIQLPPGVNPEAYTQKSKAKLD